MRAIQFQAKTDSFPYTILTKPQLIGRINHLAALHIPFFFMIDYKAEYGYVIKKDELDATNIQFQLNPNTPNQSLKTRNMKCGTLNTERAHGM